MGFFRKKSASASTQEPSPNIAAQTATSASPSSTTKPPDGGSTTTNSNVPNNYGATAPPSSLDENLLQNQRPGLEPQPSYFQNLNPANPAPLPPLNPRQERAHRALQRIMYIMDDAVKIPLLNRRVGLDPVIGLIPGVGDFGSALVSLVIVARAAPHLSRYTVIRMLINVWIDAVTGVVPLVGDIFDIGWKANQRNVAIFEDHMKIGAEARNNVDKRWLIMMVIGFFVMVFITTGIILACIVLLVLWLTGSLK